MFERLLCHADIITDGRIAGLAVDHGCVASSNLVRFLLSDLLLLLHFNANHAVRSTGWRRHHLSVREIEVTQVDAILIKSFSAATAIVAFAAMAQLTRASALVTARSGVDASKVLRGVIAARVASGQTRHGLLVDYVSSSEPEMI